MAQTLYSLDNLPQELRGGAIAVGNFDGVHRGHASLLHRLTQLAESVSGPALVMTFDPPPIALLQPQRALQAPLTTITRRSELVASLGVDALIAYPTTAVLLGLSAKDFFDQVIVGQIGAKAMVEGPNFRFGRDRQGDTELLKALCAQQNVRFEVADSVGDDMGLVSSSRIRELIAGGNLLEANRMLTQPYQVQGVVAEGSQRGRQLGFPTANLTQIESLLPPVGVYAGTAHLEQLALPAAINIGPNPTFEDLQAKFEVHVIGWQGDLYGQDLRVSLHRKVRDVRRFSSAEELREQIEIDVKACSM